MLVAGILVALFILHLPFLNADPDWQLCCSRDAWNAEGINSIQIRNYLNHGTFSLTECHNFLKMPLFNAWLFLPMKFFGTQLTVARVSVLVWVLMVMAWAASSPHMLFPLAAIVCLMQLHVFQYSHLAMSEMIAVAMVALSIRFLLAALVETMQQTQKIFFAALFVFLSYCVKIQFVYAAALVPFSLLLVRWFRVAPVSAPLLQRAVVLTAVFATVYVLAWYLPNRSFFNQVLAFESEEKVPSTGNLLQAIFSHIRMNLLGPSTRYFMLLAFISFVAGCLHFLRSGDSRFKILFVLSCCWLLLESHRLFFTYFPPRYQVSFFFAAGFNASIVIHALLFSSSRNRMMKGMVILLLLTFALLNGIRYVRQINERQFTVAVANDYMKRATIDSSRVILGSWAPAITWESGSRAVPVWKDFLNDKLMMEKFEPAAVITEPGETDSRRAFMSENVNLAVLSDSARAIDVGPWHLLIYWIKEK